ncbi:metal ion transporter family [Plasmopara halstedii]|uniref:Metal ion transporter family n=1 Tax=Plasmopara halstedii TaxID=4781 RepID=A0A0P1ADF5_PLAHL|nr:metal ion transporter family [Plasmopara halstedii]CEG39030.1 metal ion transporter family [Plasmopara halstedii]|eukprot:XP_024575399.1 metal ion transporter family [Plasmopara halstedii]
MSSVESPHNDCNSKSAVSVVVHRTTSSSSHDSRLTNNGQNLWNRSSDVQTDDIQTDYQPPDWNSNDESTADDSASRTAFHLNTNDSRNSTPLPGGNSFRNSTADSVMSSDPSVVPPVNMKVRPLTLYGKDILRIFPFGTTSEDIKPVKWSDTLGAIDVEDDYSIRDPHFDLTNGKITKLFSLSSPDENGMLSYEGFRRGLEAMGIACDSNQQFQAFLDVVDDDKNGVISFDEFLCAIQEIKLAQLFNEPFIRTMPALYQSLPSPVTLGAIEYSSDRIRCVYPINNVKGFIYSKPPSWASVRWINVEGINTLLIRRLSVRYRLHPLAIEDTLGPDVKRPKYVKFDEHSFLILQTLHPRKRCIVRTYQQMYRTAHLMLLDDKSPFDKMSFTELENRLQELEAGRVMSPPSQLSLYVMEGALISVQGENSLWYALKKRLHVSYSKVRQHSTAFLMYTIMDLTVNELSPISQTFGAKLLMLHRLMSLDTRHFDVRRIAATLKQIKILQMYCKPMREVISKLIVSNDYQGETLQYFADVQEHLTTIEEECAYNLDRCHNLVDEFNNTRASQQNDVSYILALIAAIFLPAQFLTGVYGMNFPYVPEQTYYYGYFIWWAVMIVAAGLIIIFFKCKQWI